MKFIVSVCCLFFLLSCTGPSSQTNKTAAPAAQNDSTNKAPDTTKHEALAGDTSSLRKGQILLRGKTYTDTLQFIDFSTMGDDYLLTGVKGKDTFSLVYETDQPIRFACGDLISIQWNTAIYEPAGDPENKYPREFVSSHKFLKPGKLALLRQQQAKKVSIICHDKELTDEHKDQIEQAVYYYLANSTETAIRDIVNNKQRTIICTVDKQEGSQQDIINTNTITLATADDQQVFKRLIFDFLRPYTLYE